MNAGQRHRVSAKGVTCEDCKLPVLACLCEICEDCSLLLSHCECEWCENCDLLVDDCDCDE
jgi:hypothetical protein